MPRSFLAAAADLANPLHVLAPTAHFRGSDGGHPALTKRQRLEHGRALECLAHAIEYVEDCTPFSLDPTPRVVAMEDAASLLKGLNRSLHRELTAAAAAPRRRTGLFALLGAVRSGA